jgi:hypothetical protein
MRTTQLIKRSFAYYWQTNLVVVLGVAIAVSVLAGALLIGESVRGSLRDLSSRRLGRTDDVISSASFFREELAADMEQRRQFVADGIGVTCPWSTNRVNAGLVTSRYTALMKGSGNSTVSLV